MCRVTPNRVSNSQGQRNTWRAGLGKVHWCWQLGLVPDNMSKLTEVSFTSCIPHLECQEWKMNQYWLVTCWLWKHQPVAGSLSLNSAARDCLDFLISLGSSLFLGLGDLNFTFCTYVYLSEVLDYSLSLQNPTLYHIPTLAYYLLPFWQSEVEHGPSIHKAVSPANFLQFSFQRGNRDLWSQTVTTVSAL